MKNFGSRKNAWKEFEKSRDQRSTYNEYVEEYNELTKKFSSRLAISVLSQNRNELKRESNKIADKIEELTNQINEELTIDNVEEDSDLEHLSNTLKFFVGDIDGEGFDVIKGPFKEKIKYFIKRFCEENKDSYAPYIIDEFKELYQTKRIRENLQIHHGAIEIVITDVLTNEYPNSLETISVEQWKIQEDDEEKRGRPLDESADQQEIKIRVSELVTKGKNKEDGFIRFWHHDGRWKNTPNKNQIKKQLIEDGITGELGDDAISDRINRALKAIGIN